MIWVIAGTKSARDLIDVLLKQYDVLASVVTGYGRVLLGEKERLTILTGPLDMNDMQNLIKSHEINLIIDASHPFAAEVSANAVSVSEQTGVPYIRFERKEINYSHVNYICDDYKSAVEYLNNREGNILLTIGSKNIPDFKSIERERLFVRVLPLKSSIDACEKSGIPVDKIIAVRFPFSVELNKALYRELNIKFIVTKDSGEEGGVIEKVKAAKETGVEVVLIKRPAVKYPLICYNIDDVLKRTSDLICVMKN
ncbi:MAG: precorrin-6A reductase [Spirochaetes bacterium]|nr:precorrin-6A reductase [Spirochaetota bacterium]